MPNLYLDITCTGINPNSIEFRGNDDFRILSSFRRTIPNIWKYQKFEIDTLIHDYEPHELQISTSVLRWIVRDIVKNTRFFLASLFKTYTFQLITQNERSFPVKLFAKDGDLNYWVARHCIQLGLAPTDLDFMLEENRLKDPLQFGALVRSANIGFGSETYHKSIYLNRNFALENYYQQGDKGLNFSVEVSEISDAEIFHGRVVVANDKVLELSNRRSPLVRRQPGYLDSVDGTIRVFDTFLGQKHLTSAIYFGVNSNWFHFIVEHAVRLVALPQDFRQGTPIVLEDGLHPNILEFCKVLTGTNPIQMTTGEVVTVDKLFLLREVGVNDPIDPVQRKKELLHLAELLSNDLYAAPLKYGPRIYLRRPKKLYRPLQNESQVATLLESQGFRSVYPEQFQLHEIAEIINSAVFIVAESGAAITNLIFAKKGATLLEIMPSLVERDFWKPFVEIFGINHIGIQGKRGKIGPKGYAYDGYRIDIKELLRLIPNSK